MLKKIDHIGIAVADLESAIKKFSDITGQDVGHKELVEEQKVATAFFPVGEVRLELLQGTEPDSPITRHVARRGEGIHHICFEVGDLAAARAAMLASGLRFIEGIPERGAGGSKVAFIHPWSTGGVLMELVEYPESDEK